VPTFGAVDDVPSPLPAIPPPGATDSTDSTRFRTALTEWLNDLAIPRLPLPNLPTIDLTALRGHLALRLHPGVTISASLFKRITLAQDITPPSDQLEPLIIGPQFLQAMWAPLRDRSQEWIVPGLAQVANDTLGLLVPNQRFIEAYMVGLNHEMARELLWNEYPSDQRATMFRQFWDPGAYVKTANEAANPPPDPDTFAEGFRDIKKIHKWGATDLGTNSARRRPPAQTLVLLLRAELVRRFPNVVVYAVPAQTANVFPPQIANEIFPVFQGRLGLDISYYGFELTVSDARSTPGWYFVLQEQPTEPRFHVPEGATVDADGYLLPTTMPTAPDTAASFAFDTCRTPIRVAVPAASLVPET